jgi:glutamine synthetase
MSESSPFIARYGLWSDDQARQAAEVKARLGTDGARLIRLVWGDAHGHARAKEVTAPAFIAALERGHNINVAPAMLDASGARVFSSFVRGGGTGLDEMTGSPNLVAVPDPATFRMLPWAPGVGWVLCDEYFISGVPFHFSPRHLLRRELARADGRNLIVGIEIEWYLLRVAADGLTERNTGAPGRRPAPIATRPVEPGFSYHSESNFDLMQPVLSALAEAYAAIGLPLRSIENEWGPGQVECTFAPLPALEAADAMLLFRSATRQVCRRLGFFATFMARPAIKGLYPSGWHLHQSLVDVAGHNLFMPQARRGVTEVAGSVAQASGSVLSELGQHFLGGLLAHASAATAFATPTINGYRRFRPNSLAPDRATWAADHRGAMVRVLGGVDDSATRLENRAGEPSANPYLFIASQLAAGTDGIAQKRDPGPADDEPYAAARSRLPASLDEALKTLDESQLFRSRFGATFLDYFLRLKRSEIARFAAWAKEHNAAGDTDEPTEWEQNEYFDFF